MAKHKLGRVNKLPASNNPPTSQPYPAVSVIIPLYNAEKYIGECLDSILAQTFQNFEVIVVNDCSTDASPAIVESYVEKFGGRLKLAHMKKNSGCGGEPRNKAIDFSRGEYIYFVDADDLLIRTALAEMYALAKEYDADVLHCKIPFYSADEFYRVKELDESVKYTAWSPANENFGKEPVLLTEDLGQRAVVIQSQMARVECVASNDSPRLHYGKSLAIRRQLRRRHAVYHLRNLLREKICGCPERRLLLPPTQRGFDKKAIGFPEANAQTDSRLEMRHALPRRIFERH